MSESMTINNLPAKLDWYPDCKKGGMRITFNDCSSRVSENGKEIGSIAATIGGGLQITIKSDKGDYLYFISPQDVWAAMIELHERVKK